MFMTMMKQVSKNTEDVAAGYSVQAKIPGIRSDVPIGILFKALGVVSDKEATE